MAVSHRTGMRVALAVCCGWLALPATASANHMGDMGWCPHSNVQGADPADEVPGSPAGSGTTRSGSEAPLGAPAAGTPTSTSSAGGSTAQGSTTQAAVTQPAAVGASTVVQATAATAVTTPIRLADGRTVAVEVRGPVTAAAVRKARAEARAQARREARGLAKARRQAAAERERVAAGTSAVARVQMTSPEWWLTRSVQADGATDRPLVAIGGIAAALMALAGLGLVALRRRDGGAGEQVGTGAPSAGPQPERAAEIEAELQEIIAEEHAARLADERPAALSG